jgi:hypothetical protein
MYGYEKRYKFIVDSATDSREYLLYHKFRDNYIKVKLRIVQRSSFEVVDIVPT